MGSMTVKGLGWDATLGGRDFDMIVFDMLADEFNVKALKGKDDVRKYPKVSERGHSHAAATQQPQRPCRTASSR